jgi:CRISPR/Cas system-associated exonuclease Cas4 (RecB family)
MIEFPSKGIILAPGNLHLLVYEQIIAQHGNCLGIEVVPLETYIHSFLPEKESEPARIIYQYAAALEKISPDNAFYGSLKEADFLKKLLSFIRQAKMYQLDSFPVQNKKEKDLKELIDCLWDIYVKEDAYESIKQQNIPFEKIYILETERSPVAQYWTDFLLENGAHLLENKPQKEERHYFSAANTRKQMEAVALEILEKDYDANDCMIALSTPADQSVLEQILEAHHIPYSYLDQPNPSKVASLWHKALSYVASPDLSHALDLISECSEQAKADIEAYLHVFEHGSNLSSLSYEPNSILSEKQFNEYRYLEEQYRMWTDRYANITQFSLSSLDEIGLFIQEQIPEPTNEDLKMFDSVLKMVVSVKEYIHEKSDLNLLIQLLSSYSSTLSNKSLSGVLIASRKDITPLRKNVFFVGAHAGLFPNLNVEKGLFDEAYLAKTNYPSLPVRLERQRHSIFHMLEQCENLYVLIPQSDYTGRSLESSAEMDEFMQVQPAFLAIQDPDVSNRPEFSLAKGMAKKMFEDENQEIHMNARSLSSFASCPLKYYLRYGLKIRPQQDLEQILISSSLFSAVLDQAFFFENKQYYQLDYEDVLALVEKEFSFIRKVFKDRQSWFDLKVKEYAFKIHSQLEPLSLFQTKYHLNILNQAYTSNISWELDGQKLDMQGNLDANLASEASFTPFDPALTDPSVMDAPEAAGSVVLNLNNMATNQSAVSINYRTTVPGVNQESDQKALDNFIEQQFKDSWKQTDLSKVSENEDLTAALSKKETIEQKQEKWKELASQYYQNIKEDKLLPLHEKNSCARCAYRSICRNSAMEKKDNASMQKG